MATRDYRTRVGISQVLVAMEIITCRSCGTQVFPKADGTCPACLRDADAVAPAKDGAARASNGFGIKESERTGPAPVVLVAAIMGALFAVGALGRAAAEGLFAPDVLVAVVFSIACFSLSGFMKRERRRAEEFCRWAIENSRKLQNGAVRFRDSQLALGTKVRQFRAEFAFMFLSHIIKSPPYVVGEDATWFPAAMYSFCSLLFGWWGIPRGPIRTVSAIVANAFGGTRLTLGDLVAEATAHVRDVVRLTTSAADEMRRVIAERGFACGTAVRVVPVDPTIGDYQIEYDLPINDGRDWQTETQQLTVLIDKSAFEASNLGEIGIDFKDGQFKFDGNCDND